MSSAIKNGLNYLFKIFFTVLFVLRAKADSNCSLYVFDIDNTIADTYPTLTKKYKTEAERLLSITMFPRMKKLLLNLQKSERRKVLFITARSYKSWWVTQEWLNKNGVKVSLMDIIIVPYPSEKVRLLKKILPIKKGLTLVDDLSWNHEKGEVKFYDDEIQLISNLKLRYIGYETIQRFIKN